MVDSVLDDTSRDFVQSLARGLSIIRVFGAGRRLLSFTEIASGAGLTRAAARRFVLTLVDLGYMEEVKGRFRLTPAVLDLGYEEVSDITFAEVANPYVQRLVQETGEAVAGAIVDGDDVVYLVQARGPAMITSMAPIGSRRPAYATAIGRCTLAWREPEEIDAYFSRVTLRAFNEFTVTEPDTLRTILERVRRDGYALSNQELEVGMIAIAAPVRDGLGRVRAALNITSHIGRRRGPDEMRTLAPALLRAAADIEAGLRYSMSWASRTY